jgi:hypothetical protein
MTMFDFHFKRPGRLAIGVAVAAAVLTVAACGGGSSSGNYNDGGTAVTPPATSNPGPGVTVAGFIAVVKNLIGMTSETTEPSAITDVTATTSETTEPDPVS